MGMVISFAAVTPEELSQAEVDLDRCDELLSRLNAVELYLDKAWAGIEYLLGKAGFAIEFTLDGDDLDDVGSLFGWSEKAVVNIHKRLEDLPFDRIAVHYDADAMTTADVYPLIWGHDSESGLSYLESYYAELRTFFANAAGSGSAALMRFSY